MPAQAVQCCQKTPLQFRQLFTPEGTVKMHSFSVYFSATFHYEVSSCPGAAKHLLMYLIIVLVISIYENMTLEHFANSLCYQFGRVALSVSPPWSVISVLLQLAHQEYIPEGYGLNPLGLLPKTHGMHLQPVNPLFHSYLMTIFLHSSHVFIDGLWLFVKTFFIKSIWNGCLQCNHKRPYFNLF